MKLETVYFLILLAVIIWITWMGIRQMIRKEERWEGIAFSLMFSIVGIIATAVFIFFRGTDNGLAWRIIMTFSIQLLVVLAAMFYGIIKINRDDSKNVLG